jgi:hypothetical protein
MVERPDAPVPADAPGLATVSHRRRLTMTDSPDITNLFGTFDSPSDFHEFYC